MNILYATDKFDGNMAMWQKYHFIDELASHNIHTFFVYLSDYKNETEFNKSIVREIDGNKNKYSLFMTVYNEKVVFKNTIINIKEKVKTLLICFDNLVIPYQHRNCAKYYDLVWLTSKETEYLFKKWKAKTLFLPYAANPNLFYKNNNKNKAVVFIGTPYGSRFKMLKPLIDNNIKVDLYFGSASLSHTTKKKSGLNLLISNIYHFINKMSFAIGRKLIMASVIRRLSRTRCNIDVENVRRYQSVDIKEVFKVYSNYLIAISSTSAVNTGYLRKSVPIVNLRSFEIPMAGVAQICKYSEELANYFEEDKEIIFYKNDEELVQKCRYYLSQDGEKELIQIGLNARDRAIKDHTWFNRFCKVFEYLGIGEE